jgi:hypothetical protein
MTRLNRVFAASVLALAAMGAARAAPYVLTNGSGDGQVNVGVDGYGSFGGAIGSNATDAVFNPVGTSPAPAGTTFESGLAIRFGAATTGTRSWLSTGLGAGLANVTVTGTATSATSTFSFGGLSFVLTQTLTAVFTGTTQTGSVLTQSYAMTNTGTAATSFELLRYIDGDLQFDGSISDGGGRLNSGGTEVLFETDTATGSSTSTTFVGITGEGGVVPLTGRYEIDSYSGLRGRITAGSALDDLITGDSADADQFIDAGNGYDVTLALRNLFTLAAGGSGTYTTRTFFGNGTPDSVTGTPEPGVLALVGLGLAGIAASRRRKA